MKSRIPKPLHLLCGEPLIAHVLGAARSALKVDPVLVVSSEAQALRDAVGEAATYVVEDPPLGTGHALLSARSELEGEAEHLLVLHADTPLLRGETLQALMARHADSGSDLTFLTATDGPPDFGRVLRDEAGRPTAIVEKTQASESQRRVSEVNAGAYCFRTDLLWPRLEELAPAPNGERYLTDLVALLHGAGERVETVEVEDGWEALGVDTRVDLAHAEALLRERIRRSWMLAGVTIQDPASTFIDAAVELEPDTVLLPNTHLHGRTHIGENCRIGPGSIIVDSAVGEGCVVVASVLEGAILESHVDVGPFSHLRPGAHIESRVHIGNFVEVKESRLGQETQVGHFSYIGDATLGERVNIGAGTVTCNYDGVSKLRTTIEAEAFIGSDTMLVAPVTVGRGAATGAGSVVTRDVERGTTVTGVPARLHKGKKVSKGGDGKQRRPSGE